MTDKQQKRASSLNLTKARKAKITPEAVAKVRSLYDASYFEGAFETLAKDVQNATVYGYVDGFVRIPTKSERASFAKGFNPWSGEPCTPTNYPDAKELRQLK